MGVSGSGKTTVGSILAQRLGWPFLDADTLHPPANIAKMAAGVPLNDEDRWPWLRAVAGWIGQTRADGSPGIVGCSALKRAYRDVLRTGDPDLRVVYLRGGRELLAKRMARREGHFYPPGLLDSQLADLEEPGPDESPAVVEIGQSPIETAKLIEDELRSPTRGPDG
jgi:carbohydrate kinase (thermoresistant glucokinase family)